MSEETNYTTQDLQDNLDYLNETKIQIKNAIIDKGQEIGENDTFRSYVNKIEAIRTSEDLDTELNTQDQIIEDIKTSLYNKGGGDLSLNLFVQTEEPDIKKGIWLQTDKQVDNIIQDENVFASEQWNTTKMAKLKNNGASTSGSSLGVVGNYIYIPTYNKLYKYNISSDTYTSAINLPNEFYNYRHDFNCVVGNYIYFFGTSNISSTRLLYRYDTVSNTITTRATPPSGYVDAAVADVNNNRIYLLVRPSSSSSNKDSLYRYDISSNSYTKLADPTFNGKYMSMELYNNYLYIFGGTYSSYVVKTAYKYSIANDTYTSIKSMPENKYKASCILCGSNIYIFGGETATGGNKESANNYKYDILTNTYTLLPSYDKQGDDASLALVETTNGKEIYLFGGIVSSAYLQKVRVLTVVPKTYDKDKSVIISQASDLKYKTELVESDVINGLDYKFDDVYYYTIENGLDNTIPTYYGNGTQWIKFKN